MFVIDSIQCSFTVVDMRNSSKEMVDIGFVGLGCLIVSPRCKRMAKTVGSLREILRES